ncbi:MAG TPA: sugar ABC transporter substrate-binding protein [Blastocatellia bacterium]|nr:sugar ABC transporter substrate-binding protein [Blastocatellia bacterium]
MRNKLSVICVLMFAAVLVLSAGGCNRSAPLKHRIVIVTKALDSEFWQTLKSGAEEAARQHPDVELSVLAPEREINIDQQVSILEDQILKKVSALAVVPGGIAEVTPVLDKAKAAGIPVLIVDNDTPWPGKLCYIGTDNRVGGKLAGDYLVKILAGHGKVAIIRGVLGVVSHDDRVAGFQDAIAQAPGIQLVTIQPANSERALGLTVMENLLTSHPDLNAVFATNDQMALGAMEGVAAQHLSGKIFVVGFDAGKEAVRAVKSGTVSAVIAQYPANMGKQAVEAAIMAIQGQPVPKVIDTGTALVTKENADEFLK